MNDKILKAIGEPRRFQLLQLMSDRSYCVRALAGKSGLSESAVSQHLKLLREAGLIYGVKKGYYTHYRLDKEALGAVIAGVGAYFVNMFTDLEYEYLYLDKELVVDKIMAKTKRKRIATYHLDRIEILAPIKSYHLDNYKNRSAKVKDYSIGEELKPDKRFVMFYEGGEKILLSPSEELIKIMKNVAPRKIFSD